jgi:hypothetical protein
MLTSTMLSKMVLTIFSDRVRGSSNVLATVVTKSCLLILEVDAARVVDDRKIGADLRIWIKE